MFCYQCGKSTNEHNKFCQNCGFSFDSAVSITKEAVVKPKKLVKKMLRIFLWLGAVILAIWLIVALGPLWIIAIILGLILFVIAKK